MNDNNIYSANEPDVSRAIKDVQLSNNEYLKPVSMDEVFNSILAIEKDIRAFQEALKEYSSPNVDTHWYRLGNASADDVNESLDKLISFIKGALKIVSETESNQSANIKNLCVLVSLLALSEAKLYQQLGELTSDSDIAIDIMAEYEKELRDIADNEGNMQENVKRIAQTLGKILEEKNKEVINIKARFEKWRKENEEQRTNILNIIDALGQTFREAVDDKGKEIKKYCDSVISANESENNRKIEDVSYRNTELIEKKSERIEERINNLSTELREKTKKNFFDTTLYKIIIGVIAILSLLAWVFMLIVG